MADENSKKTAVNVNVPGEAIDKAAAEILAAVVGETSKGVVDVGANVFGGLIGDRIREWRTRNLISTTEQTATLLKSKGIPLSSAKALPMGHLYALFEGASKQDDPTLQSMWAELLASCLDPDSIDPENAFYVTLEQMSGPDALVLKYVQTHWSILREFELREKTRGITLEEREKLVIEFGAEQEVARKPLAEFAKHQIDQSIENLRRLQCIAPVHVSPASRVWERSIENYTRSEYGERQVSVNTAKIAEHLTRLSNQVGELFGVSGSRAQLYDEIGSVTRCRFQLTHFGARLCQACYGS